jgi:hypothetical protein
MNEQNSCSVLENQEETMFDEAPEPEIFEPTKIHAPPVFNRILIFRRKYGPNITNPRTRCLFHGAIQGELVRLGWIRWNAGWAFVKEDHRPSEQIQTAIETHFRRRIRRWAAVDQMYEETTMTWIVTQYGANDEESESESESDVKSLDKDMKKLNTKTDN